MTEQREEPTAGIIERGYCRLHRAVVPAGYPIQPRSDMAIWHPPIVATRPGEVLLCDSNHPGPHLWPNGDEAGEWPDTHSTDGAIVVPD